MKAIHLNICWWGTPRSRPSARSNIFSLMDSLHYRADPELPHTARATSPFYSSPHSVASTVHNAANESNPFFRRWRYQYAGRVGHYYPKHRLSLDYYHRPLSPSNYYQASTFDPLIASRPISYTQLASCCMHRQLGFASFDSNTKVDIAPLWQNASNFIFYGIVCGIWSKQCFLQSG